MILTLLANERDTFPSRVRHVNRTREAINCGVPSFVSKFENPQFPLFIHLVIAHLRSGSLHTFPAVHLSEMGPISDALVKYNTISQRLVTQYFSDKMKISLVVFQILDDFGHWFGIWCLSQPSPRAPSRSGVA